MKKALYLFSFFVLCFVGALAIGAADTSFDQNHLIDDAVFDNTASMSTAQVNAFLNSFPNSCISQNNGFLSLDPTGYNPSQGFLYGGAVSAGQVINDASQAYGLNPQVILATLEKESSVVTGNASYHCQYINTAMSYGCTDSSACPSDPATESGFSQQVIHAAWLFKFGEQRSEGNINWAVIKGNWDNSDDPQSCYNGPMTQGTFQRCPSGGSASYDGYTTIDGTAVHMDTGSTASLYWYTPHFPGNENFVSIFDNWFGSTYAPSYAAQFVAQSALTEPFYPGESQGVFLQYKNVGNSPWYDDTSVPAGLDPVHLAASVPTNRSSVFSYGWPSAGRPDFNFSKVYEADGVTLAADQHVVQPGQIVEFDFNITPPWNIQLGTHREYFQPVLEGAQNWNIGGLAWLDINVESRYSASFYAQTSNTTLQQNSSVVTNSFEYKNTGSAAWYDDSSVVSGYYPTHLVTAAPSGRQSKFAFNWPSKTEAANLFSKVYNSDGTTLASNQHVVLPGQIGVFSFQMIAPFGASLGANREYFQPIIDGSYNPTMGALSWLNLTVTPATYAAQFKAQSSFPSIARGQSFSSFLQYKNVGNSPWYDDTSVPAGLDPVHLAASVPTNRSSVFSYGWPSAGRPDFNFSKVYEADGVTLAADQHVVQPGQIVEFDFNITAPWNVDYGTHREYFQPVVEWAPNWSMGGLSWLDVTVHP